MSAALLLPAHRPGLLPAAALACPPDCGARVRRCAHPEPHPMRRFSA